MKQRFFNLYFSFFFFIPVWNSLAQSSVVLPPDTVNPICLGLDNGSVNFQVAGTASDFFFSWSGGNLPTNGNPVSGDGITSQSGLRAGDYFVFIQDNTTGFDTTIFISLKNQRTLTVSAGNDINNCLGQPVNLSAASNAISGSTFTWSYTATSGPRTINGQTTSIPASPSPDAITVSGPVGILVTDPSGCSASNQINVTVNIPPLGFANPDTQSICPGIATIILSSNQPTTTYTWTVIRSGGIIGASAGSGTGISQNLRTATTNTARVTYNIRPISPAGCVGPLFTSVVIVRAKPVITSEPDTAEICSGNTTSFVLGSNLAGTTFEWKATGSQATGFSDGSGNLISQTLETTSASNGNVLYRVAGTAEGCLSDSLSLLAIVKPVPILGVSPADTVSICPDNAQTIDYVSDVAGSSISWLVDPNGTGAVSGTGNSHTQIYNNPGNTILNADFFAIAVANGCTSLVKEHRVKVLPEPDIQAIAEQDSICTGDSVRIQLISSLPNTTFTWTSSASGVSGNASGSGISIRELLNTTSQSIGSVTYTIAGTTPDCPGVEISKTIFVKPRPIVTVTPQRDTICSGNSTAISIGSDLSATVFSWTSQTSGVNGASSGTGNSIIQILSNAVPGLDSVQYTITGSFRSCPGAQQLANMLVQRSAPPLPSDSAPSVCSGVPLIVNLSPADNWSWIVRSGSAPGAGPGSGSDFNQTILNNGSNDISLQYQIFGTISQCTTDTLNLPVIVRPRPVLSAQVSDDSLCSGESVQIDLSSQPSDNASITWKVFPDNVQGAAAGSGNQIQQTLSVISGNLGSVVYRFLSERNGCLDSLEKTIVVSIPVIPFDPDQSDSTLCSGDSLRLLLASPLSGLTFNWTVSSVNVVGAAPGSGTEIRQELILSDPLTGDGFVDYTITPSLETCIGLPKTKRIFVNGIPDTPIISVLSGSSPVCPGDSLVLSSSFASDNQWFRNGVAIPAPAGKSQVLAAKDSGNYTVSFTSAEGCSSLSSSARLDIRILPLPPIVTGPAGFCSGSSAILSSSVKTGNQWRLNGTDIPGATDSLFAAVQPGSYSVRLAQEVCPVVSSDFVLTVFDPPSKPVISGPSSFCSTGFATLSSSFLTGNQWFRNGTALNGENSASLNTALGGSFTVSFTDSNACTSVSDTFFLNADNPQAASVITGPASVCQGGTVTFTASANLNYLWLLNGQPLDGANQQSLQSSGFGAYQVVVVQGACSDTSDAFNLAPSPPGFTVDSTIISASCISGIPANNGQISLSPQGGSGNFVYEWTPASLPAQATQSGLAPGNYAVKVSDQLSGCFRNLNLTVAPAPLIFPNATISGDSRCDINSGSISLNPLGSPGPFAYSWTNRTETGPVISGLGAGSYEVSILDSTTGCIRLLSDIQIGGADTLNAQAGITNESCTGPGAIILQTSGGSSQFAFSWSGTGTGLVADSSSQPALSAGVYQVIILDTITRCSRTLSNLQIQKNNNLTLQAQIVNPSLCNEPDGSAAAVTGLPGLNYRWKDFQGNVISTDSIVTGIPAGSYKVVAQTGECSDSLSIILANPSIDIQTSISQISSCNASDGAVSIQIANAGGTPIFSWIRNGTAFSNEQNLSGLAGGNYKLLVNANGCLDSASVNILPSTSFTFSTQVLPAPTCLSPEGSIVIIPSPESGPLTYSWTKLPSGNSAGGDSARLAQAQSGFYKVVISNSNCLDSAIIALPAENQPDLQDSLVLPGFCGGADGRIFIADSASYAGQTAQWFRNGISIGNGFSVSGLLSGQYQFLLSNNQLGGPLGCDQPYLFDLPQGSGLELSAMTDSADCNNSNGKAMIMSGSNIPNLSYTWKKAGSPSFLAFGSQQNNLSSGDYTVVVKASSCIDSVSFSIGQRINCQPCDLPVFFFEKQPTTCFSSDGMLVACVIGAMDNASYLWTDLSNGQIIGNNDTLSGIPAGNYKVTVNQGSCVASANYGLRKDPPPYSISASVQNATCADNDGAITAVISGDLSPNALVTISSVGGGFSADSVFAGGLSSGEYRISVTDGFCFASLNQIQVSKPAFCGPCELVVEAASNPVYCPGVDNGRAFAIVTSGGTGPYQYILNFTDTLTQAQFLQIFPNQPTGPFTVVVQDLATQCKDTVSDFIGSQFALSAAVSTISNDCDTAGAIAVSLGGVPGPFTVILQGDTLISGNDTINTVYSDTLIVNGPDTVFTGISAGAYQVKVLSTEGCFTSVNGIVLRLRGPVFVKLGEISPVSCAAVSNGSITIDSLSGSDSYRYFIPGITTDFQTLVAGQTISGLGAGTYTLRITGNRSCDLDTTIVIGGPDPLQFLMEARTSSLCADSAGSVKMIFLEGGNGGPYTYSLLRDGIQFRNDTLAPDSLITGLPPGFYSMILFDTNQCTAGAVFTIQAIKIPYQLTMSADTVKICSGDSVTFTATVSAPVPGLVYNWYLNDSLFSSSGPVQVLSGLSNGDSVYVEALPDFNCFDPDTTRSQAVHIQVTPANSSVLAGILALNTLVCAGDLVTIKALNLNQIPDVTYTWLVNGAEQSGSGSDVFTYVPQQAADTVQVLATALSGLSCLQNSSDTSAAVFIFSAPPAVVKDSIRLTAPGDSVFLCPNTPVTFSLGSSLQVPFSVEWFANDVRADSGNATAFTFQGLSGLVKIRAVVKFDTSLTCLSGNGPAGIDSSQIFTLEFLPANDPRCLPCALELSAQVQNLSCAQNADGVILADVTGGTGAYLFSLLPGGPQDTVLSVFSGLLPGVYLLAVRDTITGCVDTLRNVNVVSQNNYAVSLAFENSCSCIDSTDGRIEVISVADGSGDNGKYLYRLTPGYPDFSTLTLFENLSPDTFLLQVKDTITGCITSLTKIIGRKEPLNAYLSLLNEVSCNGGSDGRIRLDSISHGSGFYQVSTSGDPGSFVPVQAGDTLGGFASGDVFLYIRDLKTGCVDSNFIFVPQPALISVGLTLLDTSSCVSSSGKVKIGPVSGGVAPYSYLVQYPDSLSFQPLALPADSILTNLGGGSLLVSVTDARGCTLTGIISVPVDKPKIGNILLTSPCLGDTNGIIRLTGMAGGTSPYTFTLINGFGQVVSTQPDSVFTGLLPGIYNIGIRDATGAAGCENIYTRTLLPTDSLYFNLIRFKSSTCENFDGEAIFVLRGGQKPYRYSYDSTTAGQFTAFKALNSDTLRLTGLSARIPGQFYTLRILDNGPDGGCSYDTTFVQPGQAPLQYQFSRKNVKCFGEATGSVILSGIRGTGPLVLRVRRVGSEEVIAFDTLEGSFFQNSSFELGGIPAGDFNLEVKQFGICSGSRSIPFTLTQPSEITISARMFRKSATGFRLGGIRLDSVRGGSSPYQMSFNNGPVFTYRGDTLFRNLNPGEYTIRVQDDSSCVAEKEIECEDDEDLFVPNLFTPNGDGLNDRLEIRNLPSGSRFIVKDRWGKEVFRSEDYQNDWAGTDQEAGTYFWLLEIQGQGERSGWITIER